ncbi:lactadherin [Nematostella vectensis]|uniref:lactadherin n=1 Tax=Nematostella vectensis TaxID=45351 RepID=UPI0013900CC2|nr:lactadherin [Nematostella vectensis]XP_048576961.1 lactadherin [Nematostella vectensis]
MTLGSGLSALCLIMSIATCLGQNLLHEVDDYYRRSIKFVAQPGKRLLVPISGANTSNETVTQKSLLANDIIDCTFECLAEKWCHSLNVKLTLTKSGQHVCELIVTDKYNHSEYLVQDNDSVHLGIKTQCFTNPCLNGGTCQPIYQDNNYTCTCILGYIGRHCDVCIPQLGMDYRNKIIADSQITASTSSYYWSFFYGRLHQVHISGVTYGAWSPHTSQVGEYLQVDLLRMMQINKVATQGQPTQSIDGTQKEPNMNNWVTRYGLSYSSDGLTWTTYPHEFNGNSDRDTVVSHILPVTIPARFIRVLPKNWHGIIALRVELFGCHLHQ